MKIQFKNILGTIISLVQNSNTAIRTYTFQDRDGTIADNTDLAGKQNALGFTPENVANKDTTTTLGTSDTNYPSQKAVKTYVDNQVASAGSTSDEVEFAIVATQMRMSQ